ncbi:MAG: hypothetical protein FJX30_01620 [Alphaproteobacteria bacterium]|nr:hypothetical protein [Alphaproteobacteria bacterium]
MLKIRLENIIDFAKKPREKLVKIFKSEGFRIAIIIFSCLFAFAWVFPSFLDNNRLKFDITQRLSKLTQSTISIKGDLTVSLLPVPTITASNVFIENYALPNKRNETDNFYNIYIKNLKIIFPVLKFNNRQLIKKIIADDCVIEIAQPEVLKKIDNSLFNTYLKKFPQSNENSKNVVESGLSSKIFSVADLESTAIFISSPPSIQLNDSIITFFNETGVSKEFTDVYSTILYDKDSINGYGSFVSQNIDNEFKINAKFNSIEKQPDSFFSLNSPILNLQIKGNFLENNNNGLLKTRFNGTMEAEVTELKSFYKSLVSSTDLVANKLKFNSKNIKLSSLLSNDGKNLEFKRMLINSDVINGIGDIFISVGSNQILTSDIKFTLDDLDIDNLWSTDNPAKKLAELNKPQEIIENAKSEAENNENSKNLTNEKSDKNKSEAHISGNAEQKITFKSSVIKVKKRSVSDLILEARDYDINIEIDIKKATLYEGKIEDVKLYANIANQGKLMVSPLSFKLAGNSDFRINGIVDETNGNTKFTGYLDGSGESLSEVFKWLKIRPENIKIDNLKKYNLYSDIEADQSTISLNNFYINLDDKKTEFYGDLLIKDFEKKRSISTNIKASEFDIDKYILFSKNNIYLREGILFDKLLWLNEVFSDYNLKLKFDKLIYANQEFKDQILALEMGQGFIKFPKTHFASDKNIFDLEFNFDISDKNQLANFSLKAEKLNFPFRDEITDMITNKNRTIFDKFFELPSLQGFSGEIDLSAKQIQIDDKMITDFEYKNSFKNSVFGQTKTSMKIYDGSFEFKGLNDIKYNKIINGTFSCKTCNVNKILNDFYNVNAIGGLANISGNIVSIAKSAKEFSTNLNSEISLAISSPRVEGYGLTDLVKKMFAVKNYALELTEPEKILEKKESSTQFLEGKGYINFKGDKNSNFSISFKAPAINSVFSGMIFLKDESINGTLNTIFISGTPQKQIPINIATNVVGFFDDVAQVSNLNQVRQYLGLERINNQELSTILKGKAEQKKLAKENRILNKIKTPQKKEIDSQDNQNSNIIIDNNPEKPSAKDTKNNEITNIEINQNNLDLESKELKSNNLNMPSNIENQTISPNNDSKQSSLNNTQNPTEIISNPEISNINTDPEKAQFIDNNVVQPSF